MQFVTMSSLCSVLGDSLSNHVGASILTQPAYLPSPQRHPSSSRQLPYVAFKPKRRDVTRGKLEADM